MSQLPKEHTHYVTPHTEGSRHGIHAGLARKLTDKMGRNEIAKLPQNSELRSGWFGVSFYHLCRVAELKSHANHFFFCFSQNSYGIAVKPRSRLDDLDSFADVWVYAYAQFPGRLEIPGNEHLFSVIKATA